MAAKLLNLSQRRLGTEGAKVLAHVMKVSEVLANLELMGNNIGDEGATALASALRALKTRC